MNVDIKVVRVKL